MHTEINFIGGHGLLQPRVPKRAVNAREGGSVKSCLEHDLGNRPTIYSQPPDVHIDPRQGPLLVGLAPKSISRDGINNDLVQSTSTPRTSGIERRKVDVCDKNPCQGDNSKNIRSPNKVNLSRRKKRRGIPIVPDSSPLNLNQVTKLCTDSPPASVWRRKQGYSTTSFIIRPRKLCMVEKVNEIFSRLLWHHPHHAIDESTETSFSRTQTQRSGLGSQRRHRGLQSILQSAKPFRPVVQNRQLSLEPGTTRNTKSQNKYNLETSTTWKRIEFIPFEEHEKLLRRRLQ